MAESNRATHASSPPLSYGAVALLLVLLLCSPGATALSRLLLWSPVSALALLKLDAHAEAEEDG